jgi:starch synthase (maltosyl-transferring)
LAGREIGYHTAANDRAPDPSDMQPHGPLIYNLFPLLAGPFEGWGPHLVRARELGFDWLFFNPVSYPGFSGSLYAVKDYFGFHPVVAPKGPKAGTRAFAAVLKEMHAAGLAPMMDLVINHTSVDCPLTLEHPDWYARDAAGKVMNPGAMDDGKWVSWGDLATVDNAGSADRDALWDYWDRLITHHQGLGVKGFRCDAAYQVPADLWRHLISRARARDAEAVFFAESLGCPIEDVVRLAGAGFAYTFNSAKWWDFQAPWCLAQYTATAPLVTGTIAFPESHDTPRLAEELGGDAGAVLARYAFAAFFSSGLMMPMGFEFGARRRLNVVRTRPADWDAPDDLRDAIAEVNAVKAAYPVFNQDGPMTRLPDLGEGVTALEKRTPDGAAAALLLITREPEAAPPPDPATDLGAVWASAREITPACLASRHAGLRAFVRG